MLVNSKINLFVRGNGVAYVCMEVERKQSTKKTKQEFVKNFCSYTRLVGDGVFTLMFQLCILNLAVLTTPHINFNRNLTLRKG